MREKEILTCHVSPFTSGSSFPILLHMKRLIYTLFFSLCAVAAARAQGEGLPRLEIEDVTVIGRRTVVLPKARKGEVLDTSLYRLPPGDTMLFGPRISNLAGTGGTLPEYREVEPPLHANAELSIGSFLSPRASLRAEYRRRSFDLGGIIDYRGTAGHIDSAEASSLLIGAHASTVLGDEVLPLKSFRLSGGFDRLGDSYFLYGSTTAPADRSRTSTRFTIGLQSQERQPVEYGLRIEYSSTAVEDRVGDTIPDVSASTPSFGFNLAADLDTLLRLKSRIDYSTTSLRYATPTLSPAYVALQGDLEWQPLPRLFLIGGLLYANGQNSDSGSSTLIMPRFSARYELSPMVSLFGWFAPELRAASYRDRMMAAPYVSREILLRPERVPVRLAVGARVAVEGITAEARGFVEKGENTPVVVATLPGELSYAHVDSRTVGVAANIKLHPASALAVEGEALFRSTVDDSLDRDLPMIPSSEFRARATYSINSELQLFSTLLYQSAQQTRLFGTEQSTERVEIPSRFLLSAGASYQFVEKIEGFAEITNLLGQKYYLWENYLGPGFEIRGGIRATF